MVVNCGSLIVSIAQAYQAVCQFNIIWLACWLVSWLVGWLCSWLFGHFLDWSGSSGWLVGWSHDCLVAWLLGWLVFRLVGWLLG